MRCRRIALVVSAGAVLLGAGATAHAVADFKTPGNAAYCGISHGLPPLSLICWTPNDGFTISMTSRSKPSYHYAIVNKGLHDVVGRVLRFGQRWTAGPWTCTSKRTGLTCDNRAHHGWWLGRFRGYSVF